MQILKTVGICAFSLLVTAGVSQTITKAVRPNHPPPLEPNPTPTLSGFGGLIPGETQAQGSAWVLGRAQFKVVDTADDGLGPIFNNQSCFACHTQPDLN